MSDETNIVMTWISPRVGVAQLHAVTLSLSLGLGLEPCGLVNNVGPNTSKFLGKFVSLFV